jgi:hypothetical protein
MEVSLLAINSIKEIMLSSRIRKEFVGIELIWLNLRISVALKTNEKVSLVGDSLNLRPQGWPIFGSLAV